ncbi:MAG: hypothetical protein II075_06460 [Bacteroidales bacterium]|nr:hypothetical protein [Bacteroidales bacterium]MBQ2096688.1 hypothetical protein [Bacteroidales bacterium]
MGLYWTAGISAKYSGIAQSIFLGAKEARTDAQMGNRSHGQTIRPVIRKQQ